jgi:hypothetical protein
MAAISTAKAPPPIATPIATLLTVSLATAARKSQLPLATRSASPGLAALRRRGLIAERDREREISLSQIDEIGFDERSHEKIAPAYRSAGVTGDPRQNECVDVRRPAHTGPVPPRPEPGRQARNDRRVLDRRKQRAQISPMSAGRRRH